MKNRDNLDGLSKRVIDMTGEELIGYFTQAVTEIINAREFESTKPRHILRGYKELAAFLHCHASTVHRKVACADIHPPAVIRSGKMILFDADLVLEQLQQLSDGAIPIRKQRRGYATR